MSEHEKETTDLFLMIYKRAKEEIAAILAEEKQDNQENPQ